MNFKSLNFVVFAQILQVSNGFTSFEEFKIDFNESNEALVKNFWYSTGKV